MTPPPDRIMASRAAVAQPLSHPHMEPAEPGASRARRDAAVTVSPFSVTMISEVPGLPPTGALLIRVWVEPDDTQLRLALTSRSDVESGEEGHHNAGTIDEALDYTQRWLRDFSRARGACET